MMISFASVPLSDRAVARVSGGAALPDGLQELTVSLEFKCSLTGEWFSWSGDAIELRADADSDGFEDTLRAAIAKRVNIDQNWLSPAGYRLKERNELDERLAEKIEALHALIEAQGESELSKLALEVVQIGLDLNEEYMLEIDAIS